MRFVVHKLLITSILAYMVMKSTARKCVMRNFQTKELLEVNKTGFVWTREVDLKIWEMKTFDVKNHNEQERLTWDLNEKIGHIRNELSFRCLDGRIATVECRKDEGPRWHLMHSTKYPGKYKFRNNKTGNCLQQDNTGGVWKALSKLAPCNDEQNLQVWELLDITFGFLNMGKRYRLKNYQTKELLESKAGEGVYTKPEVRDRILTEKEKDRFTWLMIEKTGQIMNVDLGYCLDGDIQHSLCGLKLALKRWHLINSTKVPGKYNLRNNGTGNCLQVDNAGGLKSRKPSKPHPCNVDENLQIWEMIEVYFSLGTSS